MLTISEGKLYDINYFSCCYSAQLSAAAALTEQHFQRGSTAGIQHISPVGGGGYNNELKQPPPLLRSRTLPAIIVPGINILQAQIDPKPTQQTGKYFCSIIQVINKKISSCWTYSISTSIENYIILQCTNELMMKFSAVRS